MMHDSGGISLCFDLINFFMGIGCGEEGKSTAHVSLYIGEECRAMAQSRDRWTRVIFIKTNVLTLVLWRIATQLCIEM